MCTPYVVVSVVHIDYDVITLLFLVWAFVGLAFLLVAGSEGFREGGCEERIGYVGALTAVRPRWSVATVGRKCVLQEAVCRYTTCTASSSKVNIDIDTMRFHPIYTRGKTREDIMQEDIYETASMTLLHLMQIHYIL